jgi:hypothetical protein
LGGGGSGKNGRGKLDIEGCFKKNSGKEKRALAVRQAAFFVENQRVGGGTLYFLNWQ